MERRRVGILVFPDVEVLDFCGPFEVFSAARLDEGRRREEPSPYEVVTVAEGPGVRDLMTRLRVKPGADHVAYFGNALHVTGSDLDKLKALIAQDGDKTGVTWRQEPPNLEDVFIHLMDRSVDKAGIDK